MKKKLVESSQFFLLATRDEKSCHTIDFLIALYYLSIIVLVINWKFVLSEILLPWEEENPRHKAYVFITIKPKKAIIKHTQFNFICGAEALFVPFWFPPFSVNLWWKSSFHSQIARTATILAGACTSNSLWRGERTSSMMGKAVGKFFSGMPFPLLLHASVCNKQ